MNYLSIFNVYNPNTNRGIDHATSLTSKPYNVQNVLIPPPCPLNISDNDWVQALEELSKNLTLEVWCDAVFCGFAKSEMGQSTGWMWHDTLIEKFGLHELPDSSFRTLINVLSFLWNEFPITDPIASVGLYPEDRQQLTSLIQNYGENKLVEFVWITYVSYEGRTHDWTEIASIGRLVDRISNYVPIPSHVCLYKKMKRFAKHYEISSHTTNNQIIYIPESKIRRAGEGLFQHMKENNQREPNKSMEDVIKEWDEMDEAYTYNFETDIDILSTFVAFAKIADYASI